MARGGARTGAGRKPGSQTRVDRELRERALADAQETPLEYMLRIMRDSGVDPGRRDDMAKAAAPYVHAKLASVEHGGPNGGAIKHAMTIGWMTKEEAENRGWA
jgi:hypothetical protein